MTLLVKQETESGDDSQEFCVNCVSYGDDNNKRNLKSLITSLFHWSVSPTPLGLGFVTRSCWGARTVRGEDCVKSKNVCVGGYHSFPLLWLSNIEKWLHFDKKKMFENAVCEAKPSTRKEAGWSQFGLQPATTTKIHRRQGDLDNVRKFRFYPLSSSKFWQSAFINGSERL